MHRNDRALTACTMLGHATFHTYELVLPVFVAVWLDVFGVSAAILGLIVGAGYALVGGGAIPAGVLADAYDSKRLIVLSMLGMAGGMLVVAAATSLLVVALGIGIWGATASLYHPAGLSLISRGARERGRAFAFHGMAGNLGVALGPLAGAVLLTLYGWRTVAAALAIPGLLAVALAWGLEFDETAAVDAAESGSGSGSGSGSESESPPDSATDGGITPPRVLLARSRALFAGGFAVVFAVTMLYGVFYRGALTFLPDVLADLPLFAPTRIAGTLFPPGDYVYAGLLMIGALGQYVGGILSERARIERALVWTMVLLGLAAVAFLPAAAVGTALFLPVAGLFGVLLYVVAPINQALLAEYSPPDVHGLSFGYMYLGTFGVGALGATLAGVVLTYADAGALFLVLAGIAGATALVAGILVVRGN